MQIVNIFNFIKRWLFEVEFTHEEDPGWYWKERFYGVDKDGGGFV